MCACGTRSGTPIRRVGGHADLPAGSHEEDTLAVTEHDRTARALRREAAAERRLWRTKDRTGPIVLGLAEHRVRRAVCRLLACGRYLQLDAAAWQTSWVGERIDPLTSQTTSPEQVAPGLRRELIDCWVLVSNAGGAVGFPFLPVDVTHVAPVADKLFAGLSPECSRLVIARTGDRDGPGATSPRGTRRDGARAVLRQARLDRDWPLARCAPAGPR